jgi:putative acetyltransferase
MATSADSGAAAAVVEAVFREYGFTWDRDGYNADLYDLQGHYLGRGDPFWVAESMETEPKGDIVATCGLALFPVLPGRLGELIQVDGETRIAAADCSLERLYVLPSIRRGGLGSALLEIALAHARGEGKRAMEIWSDKKLTLAHRLYERFGATRVGDRICDDPDESPEWGMVLEL